MAAHHEASSDPPAAKKGKIEDERAYNGSSSYIPTEGETSPQFSVVFSMKNEKGALVKALELCKVSYQPTNVPFVSVFSITSSLVKYWVRMSVCLHFVLALYFWCSNNFTVECLRCVKG